MRPVLHRFLFRSKLRPMKQKRLCECTLKRTLFMPGNSQEGCSMSMIQVVNLTFAYEGSYDNIF